MKKRTLTLTLVVLSLISGLGACILVPVGGYGYSGDNHQGGDYHQGGEYHQGGNYEHEGRNHY